MSILLISRSEEKLKEQSLQLKSQFNVPVKYLVYNFTDGGAERKRFYGDILPGVLTELHQNGGIGLLVNNVGVANLHPIALEEQTDADVDDMLHCNIMSVVDMTRAVIGLMKERKAGGIISISSGSGNGPSSFLSLYSATKCVNMLPVSSLAVWL